MYSLNYNSFWNFSSAAVQELLAKSDLQLDELLDEEGLMVEVKNQNKNLYEFLLKEENLKDLISYATTIPDIELHQNNQKKLYKYPFTCADILSSDFQLIVSEFFKSAKDLKEDRPKSKSDVSEGSDTLGEKDDEVNLGDDDSLEKIKTVESTHVTDDEKDASPEANIFPYLDFLFDFLNTDKVNLTSAGYFAKIVNNLLNKRPTDLITYVYEKKPEFLNKMIQHIASKSIAEFLAKLLTFESSVLNNPKNPVYNEKRSEILREIIKKLKPECDLEEINNTAYLICEVLGKYNMMHSSQQILQNLLDKQSIDFFFDVLKTGKSTSACAVALILGNIFAYYILVNSPKPHDSDYEPAYDEPAEPTSPQNQHQTLELNEDIPLIAAFIENLGAIVKFIESNPEETIPGQYGSGAAPFGSARLKVLELIIIAMKAGNAKIYDKLVEENFFQVLTTVFTRHNWNNILHNQIEKIFTHVLDSGADDLKAILFTKVKLLDFIIDNTRDQDYTLPGKHARKVRKGYLGHLIRLSNKINESKDPVILKFTEENARWKDYTQSLLEETNRRDRTNIGGRDPRDRSPEEDIQLDPSSFLDKFSRFNRNARVAQQEINNDKDDDDDLEHEEVEDLVNEDDDDERVQEEEQNTNFVPNRHSYGPFNPVDNFHEETKEDLEIETIVTQPADLKVVEEILDPSFHANTFWARGHEHFTADDILEEMGL